MRSIVAESAWQLIQTIFNILNHILIIIVTIYMTYLAFTTIDKEKPLMILHATLCSLGVSAKLK